MAVAFLKNKIGLTAVLVGIGYAILNSPIIASIFFVVGIIVTVMEEQ